MKKSLSYSWLFILISHTRFPPLNYLTILRLRFSRVLAIFYLCITANLTLAAGGDKRLNIFTLLDGRAVQASTTANTLEPWPTGDLNTLRFDENARGYQFGQAVLGANLRLGDTLRLKGYGTFYDDAGEFAGLNELYLQHRPFPRHGYRLSTRLGIFYPRLSLENTAPGWTAANLLSNSAINAWIGEEIKYTGIQFTLERIGKFHAKPWNGAIELALFTHNDPAGSLLAWRGWALHDRQIRYREPINSSIIREIQQRGAFELQGPTIIPNKEVDKRIGYSIAASLQPSLSFLPLFNEAQPWHLKILHYDNLADPLVIKHGQYGWHTQFTHLAMSSPWFGSFRLQSQWLVGSTEMGDVIDEKVLADYQSRYLSAQYRLKQWQFTLRYDDFEVVDKDKMPVDNNNQTGHAWLLAGAYTLNKNMKLIVEGLWINEQNFARQYANDPIGIKARQVQVALQWRGF